MWPMPSDKAAEYRFQRCFECGEHVFVRIAHEAVGQFTMCMLILVFGKCNLLADELHFALKMKRQVGRSSGIRQSYSILEAFLGALLYRSPHFFRHHSRLPHLCFLLVQRAIASLRLCCLSAQDERADLLYWLISRLWLAGAPWR